MSQVQTIELPQHLDPLLTVEDVAARLNVSRVSIALPQPTKKTGTIHSLPTPGGASDVSDIHLVNWVQVPTADDRHLHPSVYEGAHVA